MAKGKGKGWWKQSHRHAEAARKGSSGPGDVKLQGYKPGQGATARAPKTVDVRALTGLTDEDRKKK